MQAIETAGIDENLVDDSANSEGNQYAIQMRLADQIVDVVLEGYMYIYYIKFRLNKILAVNMY